MIRDLTLEEVIEQWDKRGPHLRTIASDLKHQFNVRSILDWIRDGKIYVIGDDEGDFTFIWMIQKYPQGKSALAYGLAGQGMKKWLRELIRKFEEHARAEGCNFMETGGRPGWEKLLRPDEKRFYFKKEL